jgi:hypothetical protein
MRYTIIAFVMLASEAFSGCPNPPSGFANNKRG